MKRATEKAGKPALVRISFDTTLVTRTACKIKALQDGLSLTEVMVKLVDMYLKGKVKLEK